MSKYHQQIVEVPILCKYYENGLVEWCKPNTEEVIYSYNTPTGRSPIVEMKPLVQQNTEVIEAAKKASGIDNA